MNKSLPDWLAFAIAGGVLAFFGLGFFGGGLALAATESASLSGIKALYGEEAAPRGASLEPQTLSGPTGTIKPSLEAIPCPDGITRNVLEILVRVRQANPELPIWDEPELVQALSGERGFWKWIKDHVKFSIDAFGLHISLHGDGGFCGQITVMWWDGWNATWEPC
jgi:hypothetical protein